MKYLSFHEDEPQKTWRGLKYPIKELREAAGLESVSAVAVMGELKWPHWLFKESAHTSGCRSLGFQECVCSMLL